MEDINKLEKSKKQKVYFEVPEQIYILYKKELLRRIPRSNTTRDIIKFVETVIRKKAVKKDISPKMKEIQDRYKSDKVARVCINMDERLYVSFKLILLDEGRKVIDVFNEHILRTLEESDLIY